MTRWQASWLPALGTAILLVLLALAFTCRLHLLPHRKLLHRSTAVVAAVGLGIMFKAQPSTTQILTLAGSVRRLEFPTEIFLSEPLIFMLWIAIAVTLVIWGRGFFCGWVCPYGALLEALIGLWEKVAPTAWREHLEAWEPPQVFRHGKFIVFGVILAVSFVSLPLAEAIDEIEPFKTFVLHLVRPSAFVIYFVVITILSVVMYRFFCRFMCPLGGALAIPSTRSPLLPLYRYEMCTRCKICAKGCEPKAISFETGRIDYQECLQCWDCQATGKDEAVCPELIVAHRDHRPLRYLVGGLVLALVAWPVHARADVRRVEPGTLGAAVAAAHDGDVLELAPGVHRGAIRIETSITLRGTEGAVFDGDATGPALVVAAPGVTVENLTIRNCRIDDDFSDAGIWVETIAAGVRLLGNTIEGCRFGVWLNGPADAEVVGTRVIGIEALSHNKRGDCIHLWDADGARIADNSVRYCRDGIYMELSSEAVIERNEVTHSRYALHTMWCDRSQYIENYAHGNLVGLALMFSQRIQAIGNVLHDNRTHGLLWVQVTRGTVEGNIIIGNTKGLFVYNSLYNTIRGNLIARNNLGGHYWGGSQDNVMESNAFVDNEIQVKFVAARDQTWTGNFWSDYSGWDTDDDGRGEVPYRSNTLVDALLWDYPLSKLLITSPAFQMLALAEREFPVITFPKAVDPSPQMVPSMPDWAAVLARYPANPAQYYLEMEKLPHVPGGAR
jgi:nitrous oxidase accessory protein